MSSVIFTLFDNILWSAIIFFVLFIGITYIFVRNKIVLVFVGIAKILLSVVYSPFVYYKKGLLSLVAFSGKPVSDISAGRQYLLHRILMYIETALVIVATLIIVSGIINGYESFLPPKEVRTALTSIEKHLEELTKNNRPMLDKIEMLNEQWDISREKVNAHYRSKLLKMIFTENNTNFGLDKKLSVHDQYGNSFSILKSFLNNSSIESKESLLNTKEQAERLYVPLDTLQVEIRELFTEYIANWYASNANTIDLKVMDETIIRGLYQKEFVTLYQTNKNIIEDYYSSMTSLKMVKAEAKYRYKEFASSVITTFLVFISFIWVVGLFLEMMWLAVDIAGNVSKLRAVLANE